MAGKREKKLTEGRERERERKIGRHNERKRKRKRKKERERERDRQTERERGREREREGERHTLKSVEPLLCVGASRSDHIIHFNIFLSGIIKVWVKGTMTLLPKELQYTLFGLGILPHCQRLRHGDRGAVGR